jgi:hypothetical protein
LFLGKDEEPGRRKGNHRFKRERAYVTWTGLIYLKGIDPPFLYSSSLDDGPT